MTRTSHDEDPHSRPPARDVWLALLVAGVTVAAFLPVLQNEFVTWDDDKNFLDNSSYRGLGWPQLRWMWTTFHMGHYVPLTWMTLGLDYRLWGMNPAGYHLTSLLLHAANAAALFFLGRRILRLAMDDALPGPALAAAFAALVFAMHPLRVESVAWATERRDVLSGLFFTLSVHWYLRFVEGPARHARRYWLAVSLFLAALLSKATAMTLPAVLLALNVYPLRRIGAQPGMPSPATRRVFAELLPFVALSATSMALSVVALHPPPQLPMADKVVVSAYSLAFYVWKTVVPLGLAPLYPMPRTIDPAALRFVLGYVTVAALAAGVWFARRRWTGTVVALAVFVAVLSPMLGVVQNGPQIAADRYTYHAAPALAVLAGAGFALAWRRFGGAAALGAGAVVLAALGVLTWKQTTGWHDSRRLWTRVLEVSPDAAIGHNALANLVMAQGLVSQALAGYERAVALDPDFAEARNNLGVALSRLGRNTEAVEHFRRAVALRTDYDAAYTNWGVALAGAGEWETAIERYRKALSINDRNADAEVNWGNALVRSGRPQDAIEHYQRAAALRPDLAAAHANWGAALAHLQRWADAIDQFRTALALDSSDADTRASLERALEMQKRAARSGLP